MATSDGNELAWPSMMKSSSSFRPLKMLSIITHLSRGETRKSNSSFPSANRAEQNCNQKHRLGTPVGPATEGRATLQDSSSPQRRKSEKFVRSLSKNMYPLSNQVTRRISRKIQNAVLHRQHPNTEPGLKDTRAKEKCPVFQVRTARLGRQRRRGNYSKSLHD